MTYTNTGVTGCSARGIAKRESKEELLKLAEELKDSISIIEIAPIGKDIEKHIPMELFTNMKELK
ncbi:MAG: hypothetical protein PHW64_05380 [Sulfuricurvum sp.]|nr:hypothetical protein [Sulfuricurvum sp.]